MISGSLARRYARAVMDLAVEEKQSEQVRKDVEGFRDLLESSEMLRSTLNNPTLTIDDRKAVLREVLLKMNSGSLATRFLNLLLDKHRLYLTPIICREIARLADAQAGIVHAKVTSARKISDPLLKEITAALMKATGKTIQVETVVEPKVLGGISTQIGNTVFDGTLANQLERLKRGLLEKNMA